MRFLQCRLRGRIDSNGSVAAYLEERLNLGVNFLLSAEVSSQQKMISSLSNWCWKSLRNLLWLHRLITGRRITSLDLVWVSVNFRKKQILVFRLCLKKLLIYLTILGLHFSLLLILFFFLDFLWRSIVRKLLMIGLCCSDGHVWL